MAKKVTQGTEQPQQDQLPVVPAKNKAYEREINLIVNTKLVEFLTENTEITENLPAVRSSITRDIKKADIVGALIKELEKNTRKLQLPSLDDEAAIKEVTKWRLIAKNLRTKLVNITKEGREDLNERAKAWVLKEKNISDEIKTWAGETRLENIEKEWKRLKDEADTAKEREQQTRYTNRLLELTKLVKDDTGLDLTLDQDTKSFVLNELSIEKVLVETADDEVYGIILSNFKNETEAIKAAQDKLKRESEAKAIESRRTQRSELLKALDYSYSREETVDLGQLEEEIWIEIYSEATNIHNEKLQETQRREREEKIRTDAVASTRLKILQNIGFKYDKADLGTITEEEWEEKLQKAQEHRIRLNEEKQRERLEAATDKDRWIHFIAAIGKIALPSAKTKYYKEKVNAAAKLIENIKNL